MSRRRLDKELVRRGLTATRSEAQDAISRGKVTVDGAPALKAATLVSPQEDVAVEAPARPFVSRGGEKLAGALEHFDVKVSGRRCLDAGASTGGFTDCLLQRGAAHVVAVDVGYGQFDYGLRIDERVTLLERTNVRDLSSSVVLDPPPDLVVADVSFISLTLVLEPLRDVAAETAEAVVLVKPQFEAGRAEVGKGGVVRSARAWQDAIVKVAGEAARLGWRASGVIASPLVGPAGNVEFFLHAVPGPVGSKDRRSQGRAEALARAAVTAAVAREGAPDDRADDRADDSGGDREAGHA